MPRYRGHFYNWYDLHDDLRVLEPAYISTVDSGNLAGHLIALRQACLQPLAAPPSECSARLLALADQAYALARSRWTSRSSTIATRKLFTIGYHPDTLTPDASFYDLLASEARLASFIAIARNDVPVEHWFRLSRTLNRDGGRDRAGLVERQHVRVPDAARSSCARCPFTLLDQTYRERGAIGSIAYARARGVPWGTSESAYNVRDRHQTYQYRAFGVPDLALKRGLGPGPGGRAVRHGAGGTGRPAAGAGEPAPRSRRMGALGDVRLLRCARLHAPGTGQPASPSCARTWRTTSA